MTKYKRHLVTAALPYANGPIHIGHLAGVYVPADIYVRYLKEKKEDVFFVCGSDEHGVPITIKARNEGVKPQDIVDRYHALNKKAFEDFGIQFSIYSRTSSETHHKVSSDFFKSLYEKGIFVEKTSEQYFDTEAGQFLADRYITGTCPHCHNEGAYGDQCEKCGTSLTPTDLIKPESMISGGKPVLKETKHWYLPLDKYTDFLDKWILQEHKEWKVNVYGQCKSWIKDIGLEPRAVTRDLDWGVKVPVEGADGKVLYVWFDAPIGYISNTVEWAEQNGEDWKKYWQDPESKMVHFIGKDNIVFHCIIFPVMLKTHGDYILPDNVPANEFLNLESDKISTSRNWAVWLHEYTEDFPGKQDVLRYVLCANAPETKDNDFTWKDFQDRNNNELVAIYGNFVNRALVLTNKYFNGVVPNRHNTDDFDKDTLAAIKATKEKVENCLDKYKFREAIKEAMNLARIGNKYLADTEPWKIFKTDPQKVETILNIALEITAALSIVMKPFLPFSSEKLQGFINSPNLEWDDLNSPEILKAGHQLNKPELLFSKIEDEEIEFQLKKLADTKKQNEPKSDVKPAKENISFDDFTKMDIRVGTILKAEKVPKTDKLLKLLIDTGLDKRTVISGIAKSYDPEKIIGQQVTILANLAPRKIRGVESQGMILMAENNEGGLSFIQPDKKNDTGSVIS